MIKDKSIYIRNIYHMLSYAFTVLHQNEYQNVGKEEFENIHDLFAAILAKGIGRQLKQGLYREYLNRTEDLPVMRGKIEMPGTIRNLVSDKRVLSCEYDDLSENNYLNQILKTTVMLLLRHARVKEQYKAELRKEMWLFSSVETVDPKTIQWSSIRFQRNNSTYRMLISICQLLMEGMLQTTDEGEYKLASFINDRLMERLYEKFILDFYIKECPWIKASAARIDWALDDGVGTMLPAMQSDIMLSNKNRILIIDAKYYTEILQTNYEVGTIRSAHLYQIFTYVKNKAMTDSRNVAGLLLYARTDEAIQPDNTYPMSGNQVGVKSLDLNRESQEIAMQLDKIAKDYFLN